MAENVWLTIPVELIKTAGTSSDIWLLVGSGSPDGNTAPQSSAAKGSLYIRDDATDDLSPLYVKVDDAGADDDWVRFFVDKSENANTLEAALTMDADNKVQFRGADNYIHSNAASEVTLTAGSRFTVDTSLRVSDTGTNISSILCGSGTFEWGALVSGATSSESASVTGLTQDHKIYISPSSMSGSLNITGVSCSPGGGLLVMTVCNVASTAYAGGSLMYGFMAVSACG